MASTISPTLARARAAWAGRLALALVATHTGCIELSAEIDEVQTTLRPQALQFEAAPDPRGEVVAVTRVFEAKLVSDVRDYLAFARVKTLRLAPATGVSDLAFIRRARIRVLGGGNLPEAEMATYVAEAEVNHTPDGALTLDIDELIDQTDYIKKESPFELYVEMVPPTQPWSIAVEMGMDLGFELAQRF